MHFCDKTADTTGVAVNDIDPPAALDNDHLAGPPSIIEAFRYARTKSGRIKHTVGGASRLPCVFEAAFKS